MNCLKCFQDPPESINKQIETWYKQEQKKVEQIQFTIKTKHLLRKKISILWETFYLKFQNRIFF